MFTYGNLKNQTTNLGVGSSNLPRCAKFPRVHTGDMGNTFGPNGFAGGSSWHVSSSKHPRSQSIKLTRQILSSACLMPSRKHVRVEQNCVSSALAHGRDKPD